MANKLWIILMAVSAMTSLSSQIDLSGVLGFGGTAKLEDAKKDLLTTPAPDYNNNNNNNYNDPKQKLNHLNKGGFQLQDKFEKGKFDQLNKLDGKFKMENKFHHNKTNYGQQYSAPSVIKIAAPVENPIYSTYNSMTPPTLDDGSNYGPGSSNYGSTLVNHVSNQYGNTQYRTGQSSGADYRPSTSQSYGNKNNFTGYNVYRLLNGYNQGYANQNNYGNRPNNYGQTPNRRPSQYSVQSNNYESPAPYRGNAPLYGGYNPNEHQGYSSQIYDGGYQEQGYHAPEQNYHGPEQNYGQSYGQSYGQNGYNPAPIDLSQYISPMPYRELSEYMSPAQYNDYTERLYSTYNVPYPSQKTYDNYSNNYTQSSYNNYNKEFQMIVAVVVLNAQSNNYVMGSYGSGQGSYQGSQGSYQGNQGSYQGNQGSYQGGQGSYQGNQGSNQGNQGGYEQGYQATEPFGQLGIKDTVGLGFKDENKFGKGGQSYGNQQGGYQQNSYGSGGYVQGTLFISEINPYVCLVSGVVTGLRPYGKFGIHIHKFGDLTNGCQSIGGHYNPTHKNHGNLNSIQSHVGDLGNIGADANGIAFVNKISKNQFSIQDRNPVAGRAIGICQNQDDLAQGGDVESLRTGNCGTIQACGLIGLANTGVSDTKHY